MAINEATRVFQTLLDEHKGDPRRALLDLSHRFVNVSRGVSLGYMRWADNAPPTPIDRPATDAGSDDWIATAKESA